MSRATEAAALLTDSELNCAQKVLSVFCEELGLDKADDLKVALAFGAGMGRTGGRCGAVTGACMVLGLKPYPELKTPTERKEKVYALVKEFNNRFMALNKSLNCTDLLGYDMSKAEGLAAARSNKAISRVCPKLVADAVTILEEMP
ncbi:MAG: C_GCAxxG_C_C family protein [Dehalococcoidia bacterium]|nr:MAG: C_GCAxxG_C_C family protein [Dehalococcoidia bacterium]